MGLKPRPRKTCSTCKEEKCRVILCSSCYGKERERLERLEEAVRALGSNVLWALKFMQPEGGGEGLVSNLKTGECKVWTEKFMDSLDLIGYEIDRDKYYEKQEKRKR